MDAVGDAAARRVAAREWVELILEERVPEVTFLEWLGSGVRLCKVVNTIWPKSIPAILGDRASREDHRRNVEHYLAACVKVGVPETALFKPRDLLDGLNLEAVTQNILALKSVVQNQVPHRDVQMLLVHMASIRRSLHANASADIAGPSGQPIAQAATARSATGKARQLLDRAHTSLPAAAAQARRRWRSRRPPAPGTAHRQPAASTGPSRTGAGQALNALTLPAPVRIAERLCVDVDATEGAPRAAVSPSFSSVSSASSLSTLESCRSTAGLADRSVTHAPHQAAFKVGDAYNTLAILEAVAKTSLLAARGWDADARSNSVASWASCAGAFGEDDASEAGAGASVSGHSFSSFEDVGCSRASCEQGCEGPGAGAGADDRACSEFSLRCAAHGDEADWIKLGACGPRVDCDGDHTLAGSPAPAAPGSALRLSQAGISRILQFELGTAEGRLKLWFHFVNFEQSALLCSPWLKGVLSRRAVRDSPLRNTVKLLIRRGVPGAFRSEAWLMCTGAIKRLAVRRGYYLELLGRSAGSPLGCAGPAGSAAAARVVRAVRTRNRGLADPRKHLERVARFLVGVCGEENEEAAFWLLCQMTEFMLPLDYFGSELSAIVDLHVLASLLRDADPELCAHLETFVADNSDGDALAGDQGVAGGNAGALERALWSLGAVEWIQTLFAPPCGWPPVPGSTGRVVESCAASVEGADLRAARARARLAKRICDMFVFQGDKVLFAAALAILQAGRVDILSSSDMAEGRASTLRSMLDHADEEAFYDLVFAKTATVSRKTTALLRARYCNVVGERLRASKTGLVGHDDAIGRFHVNQRKALRALDAERVAELGGSLGAAFPGFELLGAPRPAMGWLHVM